MRRGCPGLVAGREHVVLREREPHGEVRRAVEHAVAAAEALSAVNCQRVAEAGHSSDVVSQETSARHRAIDESIQWDSVPTDPASDADRRNLAPPHRLLGEGTADAEKRLAHPHLFGRSGPPASAVPFSVPHPHFLIGSRRQRVPHDDNHHIRYPIK